MAELRRLTLWQEMSSPHLVPLITELAGSFDGVRLITLSETDEARAAIGWNDVIPGTVQRIHAPTRADRSRALRDSCSSGDLNLLQGLKPARWQWQVQRTLIASDASIVLLSELHWPSTSAVRRLALLTREALLARLWSRRARLLLAIGEDASAHFVSRGFAASKVRPFAYTPGLSEIRPDEPVGKEPVIAVAAKLEPYKGIDVLVRALGLMKHRPWRLKVAGDGSMRRDLDAMAREIGIANRITWLGWQPGSEIPRMFANAALTVLPSRFEGWGAVVNEALGVGTPVVVSRGAGAHCLIGEPLLGETVPADDAAALATAMCRQLDDQPSLRREAIRCWSRRTIAPGVAAEYFMNCLRGGHPAPPWRTFGQEVPKCAG